MRWKGCDRYIYIEREKEMNRETNRFKQIKTYKDEMTEIWTDWDRKEEWKRDR